MSNVSDLTIEVLKDIREELRSLRGDLNTLTERVETGFATVNARVDALTERVETGFAGVNRRLDGVLEITGRHHTQLESRVARIEDHLGLPR